MLGLNKNIVSIHPYEQAWAAEYEKERKTLQKLLKGFSFQIEHVGSTSVPGLSAKPIIDIALGVNNIETVIKVAQVLKLCGYYIKSHINEDGNYIFAAREIATDFRTHHIHIEVLGGKRWNEHILFKNFLIRHPEAVRNYEQHKKQLAIEFANDRRGYIDAKDNFIKSVLKKAMKEEKELLKK